MGRQGCVLPSFPCVGTGWGMGLARAQSAVSDASPLIQGRLLHPGISWRLGPRAVTFPSIRMSLS